MGMFDTVHFNCPHCSARIDVQTKAGKCELSVFRLQRAPMAIIVDLDGSTGRCDSCGKDWNILIPRTPVVVLPAEEDPEDDDDDDI